MKTLLKLIWKLVLLIVAWAFKVAFAGILFVYGLVRCPWIGASHGYMNLGFRGIFIGAWLALSEWFKELATVLDQFGNVLGMYVCNDWLTKDLVDGDVVIRKPYPAGDSLDTFSYFLGRNASRMTISGCAAKICNALGWIDTNHVQKAHYNGNKRILRKAFELENLSYGTEATKTKLN